MKTNFYKGKNVAVLGGAGFVGRELCRQLHLLGANVWAVDNLSRAVNKSYNLLELAGQFVDCDIKSDQLPPLLSDIKPFAVFNLAAAVAGVEYNQKHHNQMFLDNVQLQTIPVMVCERLGVLHFLQVSSACVYGADANAPAIESNLGGEPVGANAGYSWAKRMGERAVQWSKSNLKHAVIVRPSNIYGPGDWYDERAHVIPKLIKGYADGTAKMFGKGAPVRQFIYVTDAAEGMIHALEHGMNGGVYNLASKGGGILSMRYLHRLIAEEMGKKIAPQVATSFDPGDDKRFSTSCEMEAIGWIAKVGLEEGLKKTIEAYLEKKG
jgi:GDP-L-fucose synthase